MTKSQLPAGVLVLERGWLSSNNILFLGSRSTALVDSGYSTHSAQTVDLVDAALQQRSLDVLLNTHLHSDHCGGNAALQRVYPELQTLIPPGQAALVSSWDPVALTYVPTGQHCPRFRLNGILSPGTDIQLADTPWQVHAAPGHDPHSLIFFEPKSRTLISADALWESGFGVVFPELEGEHAFDEVAATFDLIEQLDPCWVIPGHGPVFAYGPNILARARQRLNAFVSNPSRHAQHAAKVLLKFKLLEQQLLPFADFVSWAQRSSYFECIREKFFPSITFELWIEQLVEELVRSGVARRNGAMVYNA
ncbi:MBL fold metallo-hydrolase [Polaromonas sp. SM01]|uniref:MBL fold metallo-hydrolase n=1 Tax=Polaromonas sp. SM01 TaxID=3085630 RepID=UPI0029825349|nr:MBL fold metallo-hydrolase [Polaromonas sp. SM01]MDW5444688.1 MBL fold metallo-hydrolase [Polaromonas sp. SM01]